MPKINNVKNFIDINNSVELKEENINDILARKENCYKDWKCWAGIHCLYIDNTGDLFTATCRNSKIGNIFKDDNIIFPTKPEICKRNYCTCAAHLNLRKVKDTKHEKYLRKLDNE